MKWTDEATTQLKHMATNAHTLAEQVYNTLSPMAKFDLKLCRQKGDLDPYMKLYWQYKENHKRDAESMLLIQHFSAAEQSLQAAYNNIVERPPPKLKLSKSRMS